MSEQLATYRHLATFDGGQRVLLRPLVKTDQEQLVRLFADALPEDLEYFRNDVKDPAVIARWCEELNYHAVFPLVAVINNEIVGDATLHVGSGYTRHLGWVRLYLDRPHRRHGLGRLMLNGLIDAARKIGLQQLLSEVVVNQVQVIKAFQHLGFRQEFVYSDFFMTPHGETLDVALLVLRLVENPNTF